MYPPPQPRDRDKSLPVPGEKNILITEDRISAYLDLEEEPQQEDCLGGRQSREQKEPILLYHPLHRREDAPGVKRLPIPILLFSFKKNLN